MKVVLDCDPGNGIPGVNVDDAVALAYALCSPAIDLKAVWTVFGNTAASEGAASARALIASLGAGRSEIPVIEGACAPCTPGGKKWRDKLDSPSQDHAVYPLWGVNKAPQRRGWTGEMNNAGGEGGTGTAALLAQSLAKAGKGVTLVCIGPLTNVALLLTHDKAAALAGVERIALMGGCLGFGEVVDTNFAVDPVAARLVVESGIPLTVVPLDVTRTTELSLERWRGIGRELAPGDSLLRTRYETIGRWLEPWIAYSQATRPVNGMWIHDLVTVAGLVQPGILTQESVRVRVETTGKLVRQKAGVEVDLVTGVDNEALIATWVDTVLSRR